MGKIFVEDERPCDLCVNATRYGCVSWNCEYINRDEAIKAWREKHEMADRKTENSSEKPNNCEDEPQTYVINPQEPTNDDKCFECDDFFTCGGQCNKVKDKPHIVGKHADVVIIDESQTDEDCDYCKMTHKYWYEHCDTCKHKPKTKPTISKMEQVEDEPRLTAKCLNCANGSSYKCSKCDGEMYYKYEPQTEQVGVPFGLMDEATFKEHCLNCQRDTADIKCLDCDGNKYFLPYGSKTDCPWK